MVILISFELELDYLLSFRSIHHPLVDKYQFWSFIYYSIYFLQQQSCSLFCSLHRYYCYCCCCRHPFQFRYFLSKTLSKSVGFNKSKGFQPSSNQSFSLNISFFSKSSLTSNVKRSIISGSFEKLS